MNDIIIDKFLIEFNGVDEFLMRWTKISRRNIAFYSKFYFILQNITKNILNNTTIHTKLLKFYVKYM